MIILSRRTKALTIFEFYRYLSWIFEQLLMFFLPIGSADNKADGIYAVPINLLMLFRPKQIYLLIAGKY